MDKPCDICGDTGVFEAIVTCSECKSARQHLYCMSIFRTEEPLFWSCEECDPNKLVSPRSMKEHVTEASTQKVPGLMHPSTKLAGGPDQKTYASRFSFKERGVHTGRTKYLSCEEAVKLSSAANKSGCPSRNAFRSGHGSSKPMPPPQERTTKSEPLLQQPVVQQSTSQKAIREVLPRKAGVGRHVEVSESLKKLEKTNTVTGGKNQAGVELGSSNVETRNLRGMLVSETHCVYIPALHAYWKGRFNLPDGHENFNDVFKAHPPSKVHNKVYETLKKMPKDIHFELVRNHEVWMDIFPDYCPDKDDIGLYFFPWLKERSVRSMSIMDFLWSESLVMKSYLDGVELLVLSSRLLQPYSQKYQGNYFLWGVFRSTRRQNVVKDSPPTSNVAHDCSTEGRELAGMGFDMDDEGSTTQPLLQVKSEPCSNDILPGFEPRR